ncbi:hypothetical protein CI594_02970, partial [Fischerella thermalis CCMEE 5196]
LFALSYWFIKQPGGWDWLEPTVFTITFGWFLLNFLLQIIFGKKFASLNPRELFLTLKSWKKKRLRKFRLDSQRG